MAARDFAGETAAGVGKSGPCQGAGTVLFVFAHQDDELAYIGLMRRMAIASRGIKVVWITDGAYSVPAEVRRSESTRALGGLGIGTECLEFWEFPDGHAIDHAVEIVDRLSRTVRGLKPSAVYTVAYEGGHPDHDFAHFAAVTVARRQTRDIPVYEAPLYNRYAVRYAVFNTFIPAETETLYTRLDRRAAMAKLRALFEYRSQFWISVVPILLFGWKRVLGPGEPVRAVPAWSYLQPPHEGRLFYEGFMFQRMLKVSFSDFRCAVSKVLSERPSE